ncbi:hypothetical protein HHK36_030783 [Tetracentron sinense]|uniref:RNase H type-1 domain-containing protein n=1 Tax=Tetracentron sinense TaxID=13715 RepID=A0A834Y8E9_TETSI|nr:hypothetical protein HHK36_030783 [Tetracentron sinense]
MCGFVSLHDRLPFWPYVKGMVTFLLVIPYFGGATYAYEHFVRAYFHGNLQRLHIWFTPRKDFIFSRQDEFLAAAERFIEENGPQALEKFIIGKVNPGEPDLHITESGITWLDSTPGEPDLHITESGLPWLDSTPGEPDLQITESGLPWLDSTHKIGQNEWTCAPCQVITTSKGCLKSHLQGKRHKAREEELRTIKMAAKNTSKTTSIMKKPVRINLLEDFNHGMFTQFIVEKYDDYLPLEGFNHGMFTQFILNLNQVSRPIRWCRWKKPEIGWTKLNTDGSVTSFGGLLRDYMGNPICAYVSKAPRDGIFLLELWAVWRGLVLSLGQGIKVIWVESDSMGVVKIINKEQPYYPPKAESCLMDIWDLLMKFDKYQVSHSWREANRAADHLAKMNLSESDVVLWPDDFPKPLCNIIKEDAQGKSYPRV